MQELTWLPVSVSKSFLFCFALFLNHGNRKPGRNLKKAVESIASVHTVERNLSFST